MIATYRDPDQATGKAAMTALIETIATDVPTGLPEVARTGRTLAPRIDHVLTFFNRPGTSNDPTAAINGRQEHLRGIALEFRNLTHHKARNLLETDGFKRHLHP